MELARREASERGSCLNWVMKVEHSQLAVLEKVVCFPWLWEGEDLGCTGEHDNTMWTHITENKTIRAQLERDRGREHSGNSFLGLSFGPKYLTSPC